MQFRFWNVAWCAQMIEEATEQPHVRMLIEVISSRVDGAVDGASVKLKQPCLIGTTLRNSPHPSNLNVCPGADETTDSARVHVQKRFTGDQDDWLCGLDSSFGQGSFGVFSARFLSRHDDHPRALYTNT